MSPAALLSAVVTAAALVAAGLAGAVLGVAAGERASESEVELLVLPEPALLAETPAGALRSAGGFTGFGGLPALPGDVLRAGTVTESAAEAEAAGAAAGAGAGALVVEAGGSAAQIRFSSPARLFRIAALQGALGAGDIVVVRLVDGAPQAVLRVPPDLEEGAGTGAR